MQLDKLIKRAEKPLLYEPGTAFMWNDRYISKELLKVHLNQDIDLGSRKKLTIKKTTDWILGTRKGKGKLKILDLGCGPGLYSEIFAKHGHQVTGIDISENSIEYAKKTAEEKGLSINYICKDYLELNTKPDTFDLVLLIYTDFGVLTPVQRNRLSELIYYSLKPGGIFIFDVLKDKDLNNKITPRIWNIEKNGFWKSGLCLSLSESFFYPERKVILYQHHITDQAGNTETYRFWTHFFSTGDLKSILDFHKFEKTVFREDILPGGDMWNGDNVIFCMTYKKQK